MTIYIIGAGAIGKTLAVCLTQHGRDVHLIRGRVDDGSSYSEKITLKLKSGQVLTTDIRFNYLCNFSDLNNGLVVLTNKSFGNKELAKKLKSKAINSPIVILQNGLGIEKTFIDNNFQEIYRCVLFATSQNVSKSEVNYKPVAVSPIGVVQNHNSVLASIVKEINTPDFKFVAEDNIDKIIWKKAIANCVFNSICPLLEVDNGIFHRNEKVFNLANRIIKECLLVANNNGGINLGVKEIEEQVIAISKMSDGQLISTLQDIQNKRETEIDTLNLEIFRLAKKMNLEAQVKETKLLGELVKLKSELSR